MAEKVQDKKIQKTPPGKPPIGSGSSSKQGEKNPRQDSSSKKGNDNKKKW